MTNKGIRSWAMAGILMVGISAFAQELERRTYPLRNHGVLKLLVPSSWGGSVSEPPSDVPQTITLSAGASSSFQVLLTPIGPLGANTAVPDAAEMKRVVEKTIERLKPQSVEKEVLAQEITSATVRGYYFSVTDKAPKHGDFKYLTQGMVQIGALPVTFSVLTHGGSERVLQQALALLKTAEYLPTSPTEFSGTSAPVQDDAVEIRSLANAYVLSVPVSRLSVSLPKAGFTNMPQPAVGVSKNPRYFFFEDPQSGLLLSGWFEPEQSYKGAQTFWTEEVNAWKKSGAPEPKDVTFGKMGNWDFISYNTDVLGKVSEHLRAHWIQVGTWIDIHLSLSEDSPSRVAREKLFALLKSIEVVKKQ